MSDTTKIEWADSTFNPWIGCTKVSVAAHGGGGCDFCYAERDTPVRVLRGKGHETWGMGAPRHRTSEDYWRQPIRWNEHAFGFCADCQRRGVAARDAAGGLRCMLCDGPAALARRRVFCASLADIFDNEVEPAWRADLFALIAKTPELDWLLLTKRIGNAQAMIADALDTLWRRAGFPHLTVHEQWPWRNVWLLATVVNQDEYDRDIGKLLRTPAAVHGLSIEPMLSAIDMRMGGASLPDYAPVRPLARLDWVIAGGESGPHARPARLHWFRSLRDQCAAAGVPFLFKQWGEWAPGSNWPDDVAIPSGELCNFGCEALGDDDCSWRVGKKAGGRLLDGVEHNGFPEML